LGEKHPLVSVRQNNLALAYRDNSEYDKSVQFFQKALDIDIENFGDDHSNVATSQLNFATALVYLNNLPKALMLLQKAYSTFKSVFGEEHPHTEICLWWLNYVKDLIAKEGNQN